MIEFCTTGTRAQLASARVLAESVRAHHAATLRVCVVDDRDDRSDADEPFTVVSSSSLGLADSELERLAMLYEVPELASVVVPLVLRALLRAGASDVVFLGPETVLYAPIDDVVGCALERGALLVPRRREPLPRGRGALDEAAMLDAGVFASGIAVASQKALEALDAWGSVVMSLDPGSHAGVRRARARGWIDHLVAGGHVSVLDDATVGVSRWNVDERALETRNGDVLVEGRPLRTFDFSGDDLGAGSPLAPVSAALAALCDEHAARVRQAHRPDDDASTFDRLDDGTPIDSTMRALYREAWIDATDADPEPPNPYVPGGSDAFLRWLREPTDPDIAPRVGRYLAHVWSSSPRLRDEFPELDPATAELFEVWCRSHGDVPDCVLPTDAETEQRRSARRLARPRGARPAGVNVVGYMGAALGLGEVARNVAHALEAAGVPVAAVSNPTTASRAEYDIASVPPEAAPYDVNLFVVTADALAPLAGKLGPDFFAGRRNIALWFWEADHFRRDGTGPATVVLDEVWAPSDFVRGAVDASSPGRPVETVRVPVSMPARPDGLDRRALDLPEDRFLFVFTFDYFSVAKRKNALGLISAYVRAFDASDGAMLVVKSINGAARGAELAATRAAAAGRSDVMVWDEYLAPDRHTALLSVCDAYVSLHRAEGLGLTMAEAMALGKPVIATGYSGNLEFMDDDVAFLVRSTLEPIGPGVDPYPPDAHWAEPDVEHAAAQMRRVFDDREHAARVGRRAAETIRSQWSSAAVGPRLAALVEQARARPRDPEGSWREFFMRGWRNHLLGPLLRAYRFDWLADGFPLDPSVHRLLALSWRSRARRRAMPPDPDGDDATEQMITWLNAPIAPRRRSVVSRYLVQYWHDHPELIERFPGVESDREQATAYVDWVCEHWHTHTDIDHRLVPQR